MKDPSNQLKEPYQTWAIVYWVGLGLPAVAIQMFGSESARPVSLFLWFLACFGPVVLTIAVIRSEDLQKKLLVPDASFNELHVGCFLVMLSFFSIGFLVSSFVALVSKGP